MALLPQDAIPFLTGYLEPDLAAAGLSPQIWGLDDAGYPADETALMASAAAPLLTGLGVPLLRRDAGPRRLSCRVSERAPARQRMFARHRPVLRDRGGDRRRRQLGERRAAVEPGAGPVGRSRRGAEPRLPGLQGHRDRRRADQDRLVRPRLLRVRPGVAVRGTGRRADRGQPALLGLRARHGRDRRSPLRRHPRGR